MITYVFRTTQQACLLHLACGSGKEMSVDRMQRRQRALGVTHCGYKRANQRPSFRPSTSISLSRSSRTYSYAAT